MVVNIIVPVIIAILALAGIFLMNKRKKASELMETAHEEQWLAEKEEKSRSFKNSEDALLAIVSGLFGKKTANEVAGGFLSKGMPVELLKMSWGEPSEVELPRSGTKEPEKWFYEPARDKNNNIKYNAMVLVDNNRVVEWTNK